MLRILMISDVYFPRVNGVSTSIQTFRDCLLQLGHDVHLVVPKYTADEEEQPRLHRLPAKPVPFDPEDRLMSVSQVCSLASVLHFEKPFDVIHIQTPFIAHRAGKRIAKQFDIPVIETYHTHFEEYMHNYVPLVPRWVFKPLIRFFTRKQCLNLQALIVPSTAMLKVINDYGVKIPTCILPTGIDPEVFKQGDKDKFRNSHNIKKEHPVMVHIGRIAHEKNIDFLLHVHKQVLIKQPETIFIIAGEGPALPHLKKLAKKLGVHENTRFVGYLDRDKALLDCYAAGDVFVFSSRTETQGLVLLEAIASGVPVVSTAELGTRDILLAQRGALVASENIEQFAATVEQVLVSIELRQRMRDEGLTYIKDWSHQVLTSNLEAFYEKVIHDYRAAAKVTAKEKSSIKTESVSVSD